MSAYLIPDTGTQSSVLASSSTTKYGPTNGSDQKSRTSQGVYGEAALSPDSSSSELARQSFLYSGLTSALPAPYGYDVLWFEQMHTIPAQEDLGTILSDVQSSFYIYNAYRHGSPKVLTGITISGTGTAGTTVTQARTNVQIPAALPISFNPQFGETFIFDVLGTGDSTIDMQLSFTEQGGEPIPSFSVIGTRAVLFPFLPQRPIQETIEFLTDLMESHDGTEHRVSVRPEARQVFEMQYLIDQADPEQFANAQAIMIGRSGIPIGVGMWQQARKLNADAVASSTTLSIDTSGIDFRAGGYAAIWNDWNDTEIVAIQSFNSTSITTASPIKGGYSAGVAYCVPMQLCVADDKPTISRYQNNVAEFKFKWTSQETTDDLADHTELYTETYNGAPVITDHHLMGGDTVSESHMGEFSVMDHKSGKITYLNRKDAPSVPTSRVWEKETMDDTMALRRFIYWARGRQKSFWFPTNRHDLVMSDEQVTLGSSVLKVKDTGYATDIGVNAPFNHIRITLTDGTILYRGIDSATNDKANGVDALNLDGALSLSQDLQPSDFKQICFLFRARFNSDKSKLTHTGQGRVSTSMPLIGIKQ